MTTHTLHIEFEHYWHCSTGEAGDADVDLEPVTESCGLPFIPGRTLKGRLRQAAFEAGLHQAQILELFGREDAASIGDEGALKVSNARMTDPFAEACRSAYEANRLIRSEVSSLFDDVSATAMEMGVAKRHSLRRVRFAVPVSVVAELELLDPDLSAGLKRSVGCLRAIGRGKHDGFGWCRATLEEAPDADSVSDLQAPAASVSQDRTSAFNIELELIDDVVLSASSATVGAHRTLDYVPGSALLGAAAATLFRELPAADVASMLAQGIIRFGNGYLAIDDAEVTLPVPLAWHTQKAGAGDTGADCIHNLAHAEAGFVDQVAQMRRGYYSRTDERVVYVGTTHGLKTAVSDNPADYETAKTAQLFGYEAVRAGTEFRAHIEIDVVSDTARKASQTLTDVFGSRTIRLGRSKGAEYGRVRCKISPANQLPPMAEVAANTDIILYAASDIALVDELGLPKLAPEPRDFFVSDAPTRWCLNARRSFLRHRRYSLWNRKRNGPDMERQVLAKGSVIVLSPSESHRDGSVLKIKTRIGVGQAEGLGQILANPHFLQKRKMIVKTQEVRRSAPMVLDLDYSDDFSGWALERHEIERATTEAAALARQWVEIWRQVAEQKDKGKILRRSSQWRRIINVARQCSDAVALKAELQRAVFDKGAARNDWRSVRDSILQSIQEAAGEDAVEGQALKRYSLLIFPAIYEASHRMAMLAKEKGSDQ